MTLDSFTNIAKTQLQNTKSFIYDKYNQQVFEYSTAFNEEKGLHAVLKKANTQSKVGMAAGIFSGYIGYKFCQSCSLGVLPALPFIAVVIPVTLTSYNVWKVTKNAEQPNALEGSRSEIEAKLQKGTIHFGWAVDMLLDAHTAKFVKIDINSKDEKLATFSKSEEITVAPEAEKQEIKKSKIKPMLENVRKTAACIEMVSGSLILCSYALGKSNFLLSLVGTVGYVTVPVFAAAAFATYYVTDKSHTCIETLEKKYPDGVTPAIPVFTYDLAEIVFSKETMQSIFNDCVSFFKTATPTTNSKA